jgi:hypothetical protein
VKKTRTGKKKKKIENWSQNQMEDSIQNQRKALELRPKVPSKVNNWTTLIRTWVFHMQRIVGHSRWHILRPLLACSFWIVKDSFFLWKKAKRPLYPFVLSQPLHAHSFYWNKQRDGPTLINTHPPKPKQNTLERNLSGKGKSINRREWWEVNVRWTHPLPPLVLVLTQ